MTKKKENKKTKTSSTPKKDEEQKLLEEHPFETMSQIQNRYGEGRAKNGSEGSENKANRLDH